MEMQKERYPELERHQLPRKVVACKHFPPIFWLGGEYTCTLMFEVAWVEFNFWPKGAFSLLNMDVLAGERPQVEARFLSAAHHFP